MLALKKIGFSLDEMRQMTMDDAIAYIDLDLMSREKAAKEADRQSKKSKKSNKARKGRG